MCMRRFRDVRSVHELLPRTLSKKAFYLENCLPEWNYFKITLVFHIEKDVYIIIQVAVQQYKYDIINITL